MTQYVEYTGKCPICQANLSLNDGILFCDTHYSINRRTFEAAWEKYDAGMISAESLVKILLGANEAADGSA